MKAFWISLILFSLLLVGIFWNAHYVRESESYLTELVVSLGDAEEREESMDELEEFWEKNKKLFGLSVGFRDIDRVSEIITSLRWAQDYGLEAEFQKYRTLLLDAIEEITRNEKLSLGNIF